jgi:hypothetical protein
LIWLLLATLSALSVNPASLAIDPAPSGTDGPAVVPYGPGEKLVFSIDYGLINAGEGTLEVKRLVDSDGHFCYEIESETRSNRFFSTFYKVRDKVISHVDIHGLFSRYFSKRLREGNYRKNVSYRFDQSVGKVYYAGGEVFDTIPGTHDVLSALYFLRTLDLEPGHDHEIVTHSSQKNYDLRVIVHGREEVEVPAGVFDCYQVEPLLQGEGLFKQEGKMTIWLTADERRMPVLMRTKVPVGSIDASLKEYRLGHSLSTSDLPKEQD